MAQIDNSQLFPALNNFAMQGMQMALQMNRLKANLMLNQYLGMPLLYTGLPGERGISKNVLERQLISNLISPIPDSCISVQILDWVKFVSDNTTMYHIPSNTILYDVWIHISKENNIDIFDEEV